MSKKKYFPNNWKAIKDTPAEVFSHPPLSFEDFMAWKMDGWEIPTSVSCIIREQDTETGKVTEHVYTSVGHGKRKARAIMMKGESDFTVCTRNAVHFMPTEEYDPFNDPLA